MSKNYMFDEIIDEIKDSRDVIIGVILGILVVIGIAHEIDSTTSHGIVLVQLVQDSTTVNDEFSFYLKDSTNNIYQLGTVDYTSPTTISSKLNEGYYTLYIIHKIDTIYTEALPVGWDSTLYIKYFPQRNVYHYEWTSIKWAEKFNEDNLNQKPFKFIGENMQSFQQIMALVFGILFHILILISIILGVVFIYKLVNEPQSKGEKTIRGLSVLGGLFLFFLSKSTGLTISDIFLESISQYSIFFSLINTIVPAIMGIVLAKYCIASLKQSSDIAMRIIILFGVLLISEFVDVYILAARQSGFLYSQKLLPNISFTLAIIIYAIFRYKPEASK